LHDRSPISESAAPVGQWTRITGALRGEQYDYTQGSLRRAILLLAIPMVLEMSLESLFAVVDIWWVNRIDDGWFGATPTQGAAAASIGATEAMLSIIYAVAFGLGMAVTALVARRVGEKDLPGAARAGAQAIGLGVLLGVMIGVPAWIYAADLLALMTDANPRVVAVGTGYARWMLGFNVIITLLFLQNAIFRGAGDPILALKTLAISNGLNILLDPCLIFGLGPFPAMGVEGAGLATCIGRGVALVYQFRVLRCGHGRIHLPRLLQFDPAPMWQLLRLSVGTIGQFLIATSSWVILMRFVSEFGEGVGAGYTIGVRILVFALLPAWGLSNAAATLVGQNLGAGLPERAERAVWLTGLYDAIFLGIVTLVFELFPHQVVGIMTRDPNVVPHAVDTLRIVASGYIFYAWGMVAVQAFNGAGDTRTPTWLHFWFFWTLEIPFAYVAAFVLDHGFHGVLWSIPIAESGFAIAALVMVKRGRWKSVKV
jgi:putative MATE family efflux protein